MLICLFQMGMAFPQQPGYYPQPNIAQPNVRFFGPAGQPVIRGQPRWPNQGGRPQGQVMYPHGGMRSRGPNPRMSMQGMQRPGAPMMAPMMAPRPGMPPQAMAQVQPQVSVGGPGVRANYKYTAGVRNATGQVVPVPTQQVNMQPHVSYQKVLVGG